MLYVTLCRILSNYVISIYFYLEVDDEAVKKTPASVKKTPASVKKKTTPKTGSGSIVYIPISAW